MRGKKATASNYNKYYSRRFLITLWAVGLTTTIVLYSLVSQYEAQWVGITLPLLIAIPTFYIGAESYTKTHNSKNALEDNTSTDI